MRGIGVALRLSAALWTLAAPSASYGAPRVRLKGTAHLDAHATQERGRLALAGVVLDDGGRAVPGASLSLSLTRAADSAPGTNPPTVALGALGVTQPCEAAGASNPPKLDRGDRLALTADSQGRFCVRVALPVDRYVAHWAVRDLPLIDGATLDLPVDLARMPLTLRFDPDRAVLSLDDEKATVDVFASSDADGSATPLPALLLSLSNETGAGLATSITDNTGHARFVLDAVRLGAPGRGRLLVAFAGNPTVAPATRAVDVERRTGVDLVAPDAVLGRLPAGSPEDGTSLRVLGRLRCATRGCVGWPAGTIEARVGAGNDFVAASALEGPANASAPGPGAAPDGVGEARLVLVFSAPASGETPIHVRYVPSAPWFQAPGDLLLEQPLRPPSLWKKAPLLLAAVAALAWVALVRLPSRAPKRPRPPSLRRAARPGAGVTVLRPSPSSQGGWAGRVLDAHEGTPIPRARVAIVRPGFQRTDSLAETTSDESGAFALPHVEPRPGDEIVADGPLHEAIRRPLPPPGDLALGLVLRRRALLERLVLWARRRGGRYDALPDPTPGHVRRAAAGSDAAVAHWAEAVERAAYGESPVDEGAQENVDRLAPPDGRTDAQRH